MVQTQFSLSWESYKSSICDGFSTLQQNGEMVDMTIAADGHLVKVHQVLMALASPYLKDLITSAPCPHPIIFLNNISHQTLRLILEYIYTGEVHVPAEGLSSFMATGKALHIKGLEKMKSSDFIVKNADSMSQVEETDLCTAPSVRKMSLPTTSGFGKVKLPLSAKKVTLTSKDGPAVRSTRSQSLIKNELLQPEHDFDMEYAPSCDELPADDSDDNYEPGPSIDHSTSSAASGAAQDQPSVNFQFTVSIRGSLQVILNRYIYNLHSVQHTTGVRRWRCVNYRNSKCTAFVVTKGNVVLNRANMHNHTFHDKKILQKIQQKSVFSSLKEIEGYQKKEGKKIADDETMVCED